MNQDVTTNLMADESNEAYTRFICEEGNTSENVLDYARRGATKRGHNLHPKLSQPGPVVTRRVVTVEVILFCYVFGNSLMKPTVEALIYRKVCLSHYDFKSCNNLENVSAKQDVIQSETSHWYMAEHLAYEIPSVILSLIYGSVSDNVSRKTALLLPAIGQTLSAVNYVINSYWMQLPVYFILIGPFVSGVFGGWVSCGMATFSYISDITTVENRYLRIAIAEAVIHLSQSLGSFVAGKYLDSTSYTVVTSTGLATFCLMALYTVVWISDPPSAKRARNNRTWLSMCKAVWDLKSILAAVTCVFKKREGRGRKHVLMCLGILLIGTVGNFVSHAIGYLYLRRSPLLWTQTLFGYFYGYFTLVAGISQFLVPVLKSRLGLRDTTCLALSLISRAAGLVTLSFSTHTWTVFLVPVIEIFGATQGLILRSMLSRMVHAEELGRMFSTFGALQSLSGMVGSGLYNSIYPKTLSLWPGLCFNIAASILLLALLLTLELGYELQQCGWDSHKRAKLRDTNAESEEQLLLHELDDIDEPSSLDHLSSDLSKEIGKNTSILFNHDMHRSLDESR